MEKKSVSSSFYKLINILIEPLRTRQTRLMLLYMTLLIFLVETTIMVLLIFVLDTPLPFIWFIDGIILVFILFPFNYFFIIRPIIKQHEIQRQTNVDLMKSNEILERFFDINEFSIAFLDSNFDFIRVNNTYANEDNRTPEFYIGKNHFDLFPNLEIQTIFKEVVETATPYSVVEKQFEYLSNSEKGKRYWDWSLIPVKNSDEKVTGLIMILNDVTSRKNTQSELIKSEDRFRAVFNQTFQLICLLTPEGNVNLINQTTIDFTGVDPGLIYGKFLWEMPWWNYDSEYSQSMKDAIQKAKNGVTVRFSQSLRSKSAELATMDISIKPLMDAIGTPFLLILEARDITERVLSEEKIIKKEEEIQKLYKNEQKAHQLAESLRNAALDLSSSLISGNVYESLLNNIYKLVPFTSAHIGLLEDEDHLIARVARGEGNWPDDKKLLGKRFDILQIPSFRSLFSQNQVISVSDTRLYKTSKYFPGHEYIGSWIAIPLKASEQIIGLCLLEHVEPNFFTSDLIEWASAVSSQAAVAIQNAWLFEQVRDGREQLQALSRQLVEVQELERQYIARELHDEAGQTLASLMVGLKVMESKSHNPEAVINQSRELKQIADGVLENLHRISISLRPATLDHLGLISALKQHVEMIRDHHNLNVQFEVLGNPERFPPEFETAIYRIVQEALTNIVRHSNATYADVILEKTKDGIIVIVEDDGIGFDPKKVSSEHLGLVGMQERASMLGGKINYESSPEHGSTIKLEVPWRFE